MIECRSCEGCGHVEEKDVTLTTTGSTMEERARETAQYVIDNMIKAWPTRPRDVVERALIAFVLSERKKQ